MAREKGAGRSSLAGSGICQQASCGLFCGQLSTLLDAVTPASSCTPPRELYIILRLYNSSVSRKPVAVFSHDPSGHAHHLHDWQTESCFQLIVEGDLPCWAIPGMVSRRLRTLR
jgi:hypothetical protein